MLIQALRPQDIERIHRASLKLLADVGVLFHKAPQVEEFLVANGGRAEGGRIRLPAELVEDCLQRVPGRDGLTFGDPSLGYGREFSLAKGASHFTVNGNAYTIHDYQAGAPRDCVETDADEFMLIGHSLEHIVADPCDLVYHSERTAAGQRRRITFDTADARGEFLRRWLTGRQGLTRPLGMNTRNYSHDEARLAWLALAVRDGVAAVEQKMDLWERYMWFNPLSPLQWHAEQSPIFLELRDPARKCNLVMISPEVMMGTSAPVTMAGALVQHNAEVLSGLVLAQLARPGVPVMYGCVSAPTDLRNAEVSHGNIETSLFNVAAAQLADSYGLPSRLCPGNPSAKAPGARAAVETALGMALGLAAGGNIIMTALLDSTLMLSYEHLIVADEIAGQLLSVNGDIRTDADSLAVDVIAECSGQAGGSFAFNEHTLRHMKRDVYYSDFTGRVEASYEDWYDKAHRRVTEILARRDDELADPHITGRLADVAARLEADDSAWRSDAEGWWRFYVQDIG